MPRFAISSLFVLLSAVGISGHDPFAVLNISEEPWQAPSSHDAQPFPPAECNPNPCPDLSLIWLMIFSPNLSDGDFTRVKNLIKKSTETCISRQRNTKALFLGPRGPVHWTVWSNKESEGLIEPSDFSIKKKPNAHVFAQILEDTILNLTTNWSEKHLYVITDYDLALTEPDAREILESLHKMECTLRYMQLPSPTGVSYSVENLVNNNIGIITDTILVSLKTIEDIGLFNSEFLPCEDDPNDIVFPEGPFRDEGHFKLWSGSFAPEVGPFGPGPAGPFPGPGPFPPDRPIGLRRRPPGNWPFDYPISRETGGLLGGPMDSRFDTAMTGVSAGNRPSASMNPQIASSGALLAIIVLLALLLLALSAALFYFMLRHKQQKKQAEINANMLRTIENGAKMENHYSN